MPTLLQMILIGVVLLAGLYDARYRKIPNWLSLSGIVLGLGTNILISGWTGLEAAALGFGALPDTRHGRGRCKTDGCHWRNCRSA